MEVHGYFDFVGMEAGSIIVLLRVLRGQSQWLYCDARNWAVCKNLQILPITFETLMCSSLHAKTSRVIIEEKVRSKLAPQNTVEVRVFCAELSLSHPWSTWAGTVLANVRLTPTQSGGHCYGKGSQEPPGDVHKGRFVT